MPGRTAYLALVSSSYRAALDGVHSTKRPAGEPEQGNQLERMNERNHGMHCLLMLRHAQQSGHRRSYAMEDRQSPGANLRRPSHAIDGAPVRLYQVCVSFVCFGHGMSSCSANTADATACRESDPQADRRDARPTLYQSRPVTRLDLTFRAQRARTHTTAQHHRHDAHLAGAFQGAFTISIQRTQHYPRPSVVHVASYMATCTCFM